MDARFDAFEKRFEDRFDMVDARIDAVNTRIDVVEKRFEDRFDMVEKRFSRPTIEGIIAISVLGIGFVGIILALMR